MKIVKPDGKTYEYDNRHISIRSAVYERLRAMALGQGVRTNQLLETILTDSFDACGVAEPEPEIDPSGTVKLTVACREGLIRATYNRVWTHLRAGKLNLPRYGGTWVVTPDLIASVNAYFDTHGVCESV